MKLIGKLLILISFLFNLLILLKRFFSQRVMKNRNDEERLYDNATSQNGSDEKTQNKSESDTTTGELEKIDVNAAGVDELQLLTGVGSDLAEKIVSERDKNGKFKDVDDLLRVNGLGKKKLEDIVRDIKI